MWIMLQLLCTSASLVLCCDQFDPGSRQVKHDSVDLLMEDYDITLHWLLADLKIVHCGMGKGAQVTLSFPMMH